ncbi:MAG: hypothetical protein FWG88_00980 [Oscillospiraceae bacterium]|nr:hypothetical protein [Oscillospiraceae bacterium]
MTTIIATKPYGFTDLNKEDTLLVNGGANAVLGTAGVVSAAWAPIAVAATAIISTPFMAVGAAFVTVGLAVWGISQMFH